MNPHPTDRAWIVDRAPGDRNQNPEEVLEGEAP